MRACVRVGGDSLISPANPDQNVYLLSLGDRRTYLCSRRTLFLSSSGLLLPFLLIQPEILSAAEIYGRMKYGLVCSEKVLNAIL